MLNNALLNPLRQRSFRLLFSGQIVSDLGDWLDYLAVITLIVYHWHLGASALAAYSISLLFPFVLIGPFAGVWVDRLPRRAVMILCDLVRAILVLGLVWVTNIYMLLPLVCLKMTMSTFFSPARQATIRSTVADSELLAANSLSQLSVQAMKILGPAIGGVIVLGGGTRAAFILDSISFLVSAIALSLLPRGIAPPQVSSTQETSHFWSELRAGFSFILHSNILFVAISSMAIAMFIIFTFDALSALALQTLGFGPSLFGLAVGSVGLGTAIGAAAIGQWGRNISALKLMATGMLIGGLMIDFLGSSVLRHWNIQPIIWVGIWFITGGAAAAIFVPYEYVLLKATPASLIGRVSATATAMQTPLQLLAPLIGAFVAAAFGIGIMFVIAGFALVCLGSGLFLVRFQKKEDKIASEQTPP